MDESDFNERSPGRLIAGPTGQTAFLPDPLPAGWAFDPALWPLLAEAKQQVGLLEGRGRSLPDPTIILRPLEDREALQSSQLEGTYATAKELLLFEMEHGPTKPDHEMSAQQEVSNYKRALRHGLTTSLPMCVRLLRELHERLMYRVRGTDKRPGEFRSWQVAIGRDERFVPPPPRDVADCLRDLEPSLNFVGEGFDPLVHCFMVHYQFETIHPFGDGNGRIGRVVLALMLRSMGCLTKPWLYLSEYFEDHREEYFQRLYAVSARGEWSEWVGFCLQGVIDSARDTMHRCERLLLAKSEFESRVAATKGSIRLQAIVVQLFHRPIVRVGDIQELTGVQYRTARSDLERLVGEGVLMEMQEVYPKTYFAPEIFRIAYEDVDG